MSLALFLLCLWAITVIASFVFRASRDQLKYDAMDIREMFTWVDEYESLKDILVIPLGIGLLALTVILAIIFLPPLRLIGLLSRNKRTRMQDWIRSIREMAPAEEPIQVQVDSSDVSVELSPREVYYYEKEHDNFLCRIFLKRRKRIESLFNYYGKKFVFLGEWSQTEKLTQLKECALYGNPRLSNIEDTDIHIPTYDSILDSFGIPDSIKAPSLIRYRGSREGKHIFSIAPISSRRRKPLMSELKYYLSHCGGVGLSNLYHLEPHNMKATSVETADDTFDEDVKRIGREIKERVESLRAKGLTAIAIMKLLECQDDSPSHLFIDRNNRIFLTDFNNREIKLSPIHKAVFILFLKHPEGIYFKDLDSYKQELSDIYSGISGREDMDAIKESINKLVDPYDNSINEKCARIKNAFVSEFREEIAQWYFIDGQKGERKSIKLPRDLVSWEVKD